MTTIYSGREDALLDWSAMSIFDDNCHSLVAITQWDLSLLLSLLRYATWSARWGKPANFLSEIAPRVARLEHCLMAGCDVGQLIITQRMLVAAITGTVLDLDEDLQTEGEIDYTEIGLSPKFEGNDGNIAVAVEALVTELSAIYEVLQDELIPAIQQGADLEDDLANVWGVLQVVATILGGSVGVPPTPL